MTAFEPFHSKGLPSQERTRILVLETADRQIVGWWMLFAALHAEPLWIDEAYQGRAGTARAMIRAMRGLLIDVGAASAFAIIGNGDLVRLHGQAKRLGFELLPGRLYYLAAR